MQIFERVLAGDGASVPEGERVDVLRGWLRTQYGLSVKDERVLLEMVQLHDHEGDGDVHFGHPEVVSSFTAGMLMLTLVPDGWHLVFQAFGQAEPVLVHPMSEGGAWSHPVNRKAVSALKVLLSKGGLRDAAPAVVERAPESVASRLDVTFPEQVVVEPGEELGYTMDDAAAQLGSGEGLKSVSVDLGALGLGAGDGSRL